MFKNFAPKRLVAVALLAGGFAIVAPTVANADEQPAEATIESIANTASSPAVWEWDEWE